MSHEPSEQRSLKLGQVKRGGARFDPYGAVRFDLHELWRWIRSQNPWAESAVRCAPVDLTVAGMRLRSAQEGRDLHGVGVHLVRMLREVPCTCRHWREKGHLAACPRLQAARWQDHMATRYGIFFDSTIGQKYGVPPQMKGDRDGQNALREPGPGEGLFGVR